MALVPYGCGKAGVDLSYGKSATATVVTYSRLQAISPVYNPSAPVTIIYGDGKVIEKHGPYEFSTGELSGEELADLLESLSEIGFFELDDEYAGKPMVGGATEILIVNLSDKTYKVTVQSGQGPSNWEDVVGTVTGLEAPNEYIPDSIRLYANAEPGIPSAPNVMAWPGDSDDLARAASSESNGVKLEGDEATVAWKAIKEATEGDTDVTWKAGGGFYTFVHAAPIFPGIPEKG